MWTLNVSRFRSSSHDRASLIVDIAQPIAEAFDRLNYSLAARYMHGSQRLSAGELTLTDPSSITPVTLARSPSAPPLHGDHGARAFETLRLVASILSPARPSDTAGLGCLNSSRSYAIAVLESLHYGSDPLVKTLAVLSEKRPTLVAYMEAVNLLLDVQAFVFPFLDQMADHASWPQIALVRRDGSPSKARHSLNCWLTTCASYYERCLTMRDLLEALQLRASEIPLQRGAQYATEVLDKRVKGVVLTYVTSENKVVMRHIASGCYAKPVLVTPDKLGSLTRCPVCFPMRFIAP